MKPQPVAEIASVPLYYSQEHFDQLRINPQEFAAHLPVVVPDELAQPSSCSLLKATENHKRAFFVAPAAESRQSEIYTNQDGYLLNLKGNGLSQGASANPPLYCKDCRRPAFWARYKCRL